MERLVVVAKLKPNAAGRAAKLVAVGPPFDPAEAGLTRHSVYLGGREAIFLFEGPRVEELVRAIVDDPVRSAAFSAWGPLLDGSPGLAREADHWTAGVSRARGGPARARSARDRPGSGGAASA